MAKKKNSSKSTDAKKVVFVPVTPKYERMLKIVLFLSIFGMVVASYLTYAHFRPGASEFCNFGDNFDCEIVNQSIYSDIGGVPVAILGLLTYLTMFLLSLVLLYKIDLEQYWDKLTDRFLLGTVGLLSGVGFVFQSYLAYIEWQVLMTWCVFCITSHVTITIIFVLSLFALKYQAILKEKRRTEKGKVCEFC